MTRISKHQTHRDGSLLLDLSYLQYLSKSEYANVKNTLKVDPQTVQIIPRPKLSIISILTLHRFFWYYPPKNPYLYCIENPFCVV